MACFPKTVLCALIWGVPALAGGIQWSAPDHDVLPLDIPKALRATAGSGAPVTFRVLSGPAEIRDGALIVTNRDTVAVVAEAPGGGERVVRKFNRASVEFRRIAWKSPLALPVAISDAEIAGKSLYSTLTPPGFTILDLTNPQHPVSRDFADVQLRAMGRLVVRGTTMYGVGRAFGLAVFDVSSPGNPRRIGEHPWPGENRDIPDMDVSGVHVYLAGGAEGLRVLDCADPARPILRMILTEDPVYGIRISGDRAYLACGGSGVVALDISDPANPKRLGAYRQVSTVTALAAVGNTVLFSDRFNGLKVLDMTRPEAAMEMGSYSPGTNASRIEWEGSLAYLVTPGIGVQVVDVSNPEAPVLARKYRPDATVIRAVSWEGPAMVVAGDIHEETFSSYLELVRLEKCIPQAITWKEPGDRNLKAGRPHRLRADSDSGKPVTYRVASGPAFILDGALTITNRGSVTVIAEVAGGDGIEPGSTEAVFNRVPIQSTPVGTLNLGAPWRAIAFQGPLAYVLSGSLPLRVLDVSRPGAWRELGRAAEAPPGGQVMIRVFGSRVHLLQSSRGRATLFVLDVSDPAHPTEIGRWTEVRLIPTVGGAAYETVDLAVNGDTAVVARAGTLVLLDVGNPAAIREAGRLEMEGNVERVRWAEGSIVASVNSPYRATVEIVDPLDLGGRIVLAQRNLPREQSFLFFETSGSRVYVRNGTLDVYDLSTPRSPRALGSAGIPGIDDVSGNWVLVGRSGEPVEIVDMSEPARPFSLGRIKGAIGSDAIRIESGMAYIAAGNSAFKVVRLLENKSPELRWDSPRSAVLALNEPHPLSVSAVDNLPVTMTFRVISGPARIDGDRLVITNRAGSVIVVAEGVGSDGFPSEPSLRVFNSQSVELRPMGRYLPPGRVSDVAVAGNVAYVPVVGVGLDAVHVIAPGNPRRLSRVEEEFVESKIAMEGNRVYVSPGSFGISAYDATNPGQMVRLGRQVIDCVSTESHAIATTPSHALVLCNGGIFRVPIGDDLGLGKPQRQGNIFGSDSMVVQGDRWFIGGVEELKVRLFSVSKDGSLVPDGSYVGHVAPSALAVDGDLVVIGDAGGVEVVDVASGKRPAVLGAARFGERPFTRKLRSIDINDGLAFATGGPGGIQIIDLEYPQLPRVVGAYNTGGEAMEMQVVGDRAYVADGPGGLLILDVLRGVRPSVDTVMVPVVAEPGDTVALPSGLPEGSTLAYEVVSGPGRIDQGNLVFTGTGAVTLRVTGKGTDGFLETTESRVVQVYPFLLRVKVDRVTGEVVLMWDVTGGALEVSGQSPGEWSPVAGAHSPHRVAPESTGRFFRVSRP